MTSSCDVVPNVLVQLALWVNHGLDSQADGLGSVNDRAFGPRHWLVVNTLSRKRTPSRDDGYQPRASLKNLKLDPSPLQFLKLLPLLWCVACGRL